MALNFFPNRTVIGGQEGRVYDGGGVGEGVSDAQALGIGSPNLRTFLLSAMENALLFMGLIAVVVLVIAGIILVVGGVSEQARERAKNMVIFAIIGLILILAATPIVMLMQSISEGGNL